MDLFFFIFVGFVIFVLFSMCGFCCRNTESGAIYSTPVVVTSQTHTVPSGQTFVTEHTTISPSQASPMYPPSNTAMPMPYQPTTQPIQPYPPLNVGQAPYPTAGSPYPPVAAPYPVSVPTAPYPTMGQQPSVAPYPTFHQAMMNPPSYADAMSTTYQKQEAYNPGYPSAP